MIEDADRRRVPRVIWRRRKGVKSGESWVMRLMCLPLCRECLKSAKGTRGWGKLGVVVGGGEESLE